LPCWRAYHDEGGIVALTAAGCEAARPGARQYVLVDGDGLELLVTPVGPRSRGRKLWRFRYRFRGERKRITIGEFPAMRLAAARAVAGRCRAQLWAGMDPGVEDRPASVLQVVAVVEQYQADRGPGWAAGTAKTYRSQLGAFTAWASAAGVRRVDQLDPAALADYRAHAVGRPRSDGSGARRSPQAVNGELKVVAAMLQVLRKANRLPSIPSSDAIADNLGVLPVEHAKPDPLRPAELRELVAASRRHDAARERPIGPLVLTMLLGGFRLSECLRLTWADVDLDDLAIRVQPGKTKRERTVDLTVSPSLVQLLAGMRGAGPIFGYTMDAAMEARQRLIDGYGAPSFLWSKRHRQPGARSAATLRSTCGCYLTCAPSIFGGASVYRSAAQLGHGVQVAERYYLGTLRRIPATATTLEDAMEIAADLGEFVGGRVGA
jgi:integrase